MSILFRTVMLLCFLAGPAALAAESRPGHPPGAAIASAHALAFSRGSMRCA